MPEKSTDKFQPFPMAGMIQHNTERPLRQNAVPSRAAPINVLSPEVEEMKLEQENRKDQRQAQIQQEQQPQPYEQHVAYEEPDSDEEHAAATEAVPPPPPPVLGGSFTDALPPPPSQLAVPSSQLVMPIPRDVTAAVIDTSDIRAFLMRPGPQNAMVQCYIQRRKSGLARLYPTYEVYLKDGEQFLLAARRRKHQKQSNYKVSLDKDDLSRDSSNYFGKLKSSFMGTEFQMYDQGMNPDKLAEPQRDGSLAQVRQELATILYKQNVLGSRGPRQMKVIVPNVDEHGTRVELRPTTVEQTMLERYKAATHDDDIQILRNKQPKWNEQVGAYVLNFNGRVTRASVKNFQLCNPAKDPDHVVMQMGRVGKDAFTMDYQWPLCGLQAFGIALSSFDYKIACE